MSAMSKLLFVVTAMLISYAAYAKNFTLSMPPGSNELITFSEFKNETYPGAGGMTVYFKYKPHTACRHLFMNIEVLDKDNTVVQKSYVENSSVRAEQSYRAQFMIDEDNFSIIRFSQIDCEVTYQGETISFPPRKFERRDQHGTSGISEGTVSPALSSASSQLQNTEPSTYAGTYSGNYNGDDSGSFQVTVEQDGSIKLSGRSSQSNQPFSGSGKMNNDGSLGISLGSVSTGAAFQGSINPKSGALYGTWKNAELAGNFSGSKQGQGGGSPLEAIGGLLNGLGKVLGQQR